MSQYRPLLPGLEPSAKRGWWRIVWRALAVLAILFVVAIWALIGPLPSRMMQARHAWLTSPDDPHPQYFFDSAHGTLSSSGESGQWSLYASECQSGQARFFYGVSLADRSNANLAARIVLPESGSERITVRNPTGGRETTFLRKECSLWDVDVHYDRTTYNSIKELAGHARFDCSAEQSHIVGDLQLLSCH